MMDTTEMKVVKHEIDLCIFKRAYFGTPPKDDDELSESSKCCDCDKADSDTVLCRLKDADGASLTTVCIVYRLCTSHSLFCVELVQYTLCRVYQYTMYTCITSSQSLEDAIANNNTNSLTHPLTWSGRWVPGVASKLCTFKSVHCTVHSLYGVYYAQCALCTCTHQHTVCPVYWYTLFSPLERTAIQQHRRKSIAARVIGLLEVGVWKQSILSPRPECTTL